MDEQNKPKRLRHRVRQLEKLLADKDLWLVTIEKYLELACERVGIGDLEAFKKNNAGRARGTGSGYG